MQFHNVETNRDVVAKQRPIVIITSNAEKELPDAFLRRCVFNFIDFPDQEQMNEIVDVHYPEMDRKLLLSAMHRFFELRDKHNLTKRPSTSELQTDTLTVRSCPSTMKQKTSVLLALFCCP